MSPLKLSMEFVCFLKYIYIYKFSTCDVLAFLQTPIVLLPQFPFSNIHIHIP